VLAEQVLMNLVLSVVPSRVIMPIAFAAAPLRPVELTLSGALMGRCGSK
jgi:hypothetical protein